MEYQRPGLYCWLDLASELRSCVKVEVAAVGTIIRTVSVDIKLELAVASELRNCMKVEVAVLGSCCCVA